MEMNNPVLDELDGLSPAAKSSLHQAHTSVLGSYAPQQPGLTPLAATSDASHDPNAKPLMTMVNEWSQHPQQPMGSFGNPNGGQMGGDGGVTATPGLAAPGKPAPTLGAPLPPPGAPQSNLATDKAELNRLQTTGSGISQIKNPWGRIPLQILGAVGGAFLPGLEQRLPGTEGHHQVLLNQQQKSVQGDQALETEQANNAKTNAQASAIPEINELKSELGAAKISQGQDKLEQGERALDERERHNQQAEGNALAQHGYKLDPSSGEIVPLPYNEMSEQQQAVHDLKGSQKELADANAAYKKAQTEGIPQQMSMAAQRIQIARQNAGIASQRLGLSQDQFMARTYGTDRAGNAIPGSMQDENGNTVGTANAANLRPTAQMRNAASKATVGLDELQAAKDLVAKNPNLVGPYMGRKNAVQEMIGSQDPQVRQLGQHLANATQFAMTVHGARGKAVMDKFEHDLSTNSNPSAFTAGLDTLAGSFKGIQREGTMHTVGGPHEQSGSTQHFEVNGNSYDIPAEKVAAFKKHFGLK